MISTRCLRLCSPTANSICLPPTRTIAIGTIESERRVRMMKKLMGKKSQQDILHPKSVAVSQGAPNFLHQNKGHEKTLTRRQRMLNFHFMEGISDILANESIGKDIKELEVTITHVEVGQYCHFLNVFWTTKQTDIQHVGEALNMMTGKLNKKLVEKNFCTVIPAIRFIYDKNKVSVETVEKVLRESGVEPSSDPRAFVPPTQAATGYHFLDPLRPRLWQKKVALFYKEFKDSQEIKFRDKGINVMPQKFEAPRDMLLNMQGLDYESLMNQVLAKAKRARAPLSSSPNVADPLPPAVWVEEQQMPPDHLLSKPLDTTTRLSTMRNFMVNNRRKKSKLHRDKIKDEQELLGALSEVHTVAKDHLDNAYVDDSVAEEQDIEYEEGEIDREATDLSNQNQTNTNWDR